MYSWEQREANDLFESTADKNHPELPVLAATQEFGMIKRDDTGINISHDKRNEATYKRVLPGQFVIHLRSFQGGFAHSAFEGITSPAYTVFGFRDSEKQDDYFWKYIFHSDAFIHRLETVTYGIRDGRSISYEEFLTMNFYVPSYEEQKRISTFLLKLNHLITLHQRVSFRERVTRTINGHKKTDSWEQRKLGEIVSPYSDPVPTPHDGYWRVGIRSHAKGTFQDYVPPGQELGTAKMHKVKENNLIVNITFAWEHAVAITTDHDANKLVSHRFPQFSFSSEMLPAFFKYVILDENFRQHLFLASPGGAGRNRVLKIPVMLEYFMVVPKKEEQKKISAFFRNLDSLITLHQREYLLFEVLLC